MQHALKYIYSDDGPIDLSFGKILNGDISARCHPIHFMLASRVGFSGSADQMALFRVVPNSIGMWEKTMREE